MTCSSCGAPFNPPRKGTGRPRTRCDACRSNLARIDGVAWRKLRAQVLREEPVCAVIGCGMPSTEADHVIPLQVCPELGLERSNLRGMCKSHNASKGAKLPDGFVPTGPPRDRRRLCHCGDPACPGMWHL
jgi:5-methylcytosine-specific restriction endonuclease McrA